MNLLPLAILLPACGPMPFQGPGYDVDQGLTTDAPGPYLAVAVHTDVPLGYRRSFNRHVGQIMDDLDVRSGLVGYSLNGASGGEAWSLSVWEDEESMLEFVVGDAHGAAMGELGGELNFVETVRWEVEAEELPPEWDDVFERMETSGSGY
jgi:hypothetical protein